MVKEKHRGEAADKIRVAGQIPCMPSHSFEVRISGGISGFAFRFYDNLLIAPDKWPYTMLIAVGSIPHANSFL
jgi:hypothetical protein